jgi:hypothetical protein
LQQKSDPPAAYNGDSNAIVPLDPAAIVPHATTATTLHANAAIVPHSTTATVPHATAAIVPNSADSAAKDNMIIAKVLADYNNKKAEMKKAPTKALCHRQSKLKNLALQSKAVRRR